MNIAVRAFLLKIPHRRTLRHLNFFQYKTYIHADLPRIQCEKHGVKMAQVPWAREGSSFTLLFESWIIELAKHLLVAVIALMVEEYDTRLWRFIRHYVDKVQELDAYSEVTDIGIDETSKKGHNYVTLFADLTQREVIFVTEGKDSTTVQRFAADFNAHRGKSEKIRLVTCDMSLGFVKAYGKPSRIVRLSSTNSMKPWIRFAGKKLERMPY